MIRKILTMLLMITVFFIGCGGGSNTAITSTDNGNTGSSSGSDSGNTVNTDKLIDTPFEGLTEGDTLDLDLFLCGKYRTNTIDTSFPTTPIKIFAAFFTADEEALIQEGVTLANTGMGFTAYELTDTWSDDIRTIYKVSDLDTVLNSNTNGVSGATSSIYVTFDGKSFSELEASDWAIAIDAGEANSTGLLYTIAHELGHASGIRSHALIDYVNDTLINFNDTNPLMASNGGAELPVDLNDYDFMMSMQGQIMENHISDTSGQQQAGPTEAECTAEGLGN